MRTVSVHDIEWDTDGEDVDGLPVFVNALEIPEDVTTLEEAQEWVSDKISDIGGFCHLGFSCTPELKSFFSQEGLTMLTTIKNPEIERNLVVSGGHITEQDDAWLKKCTEGDLPEKGRSLVVDKHPFGYYILIGEDTTDEADKVYKEGFSEQFANLLRIASTLGVQFLKIDSDGPVYPELPYAEW